MPDARREVKVQFLNFALLPWAASSPMFGSSLGALQAVPGKSYPNVLTLNIYMKVLGSTILLINSKETHKDEANIQGLTSTSKRLTFEPLRRS